MSARVQATKDQIATLVGPEVAQLVVNVIARAVLGDVMHRTRLILDGDDEIPPIQAQRLGAVAGLVTKDWCP